MANMTPDTSARPRKRKPRSPSPQSSSPAGPLRYRKTVSYADTSSDGFSEDPGATSSDMDFTSPKKKPKMGDTIGLTPAIEKMGKVVVEGDSSDFDDSIFDDYENIKMDDLAEFEEGLQDIKPLKLEPKEAKIPSLLPPSRLNTATVKKMRASTFIGDQLPSFCGVDGPWPVRLVSNGYVVVAYGLWPGIAMRNALACRAGSAGPMLLSADR